MSYTVIVDAAPVPVGANAPVYVTLTQYTLNEITTDYGRKTIDETVDPSSCQLEFLLDSSLGTFDTTDVDLGYLIRVRVNITGYLQNRIRFLGMVTDISIDRETLSITAVSQLISRYGKYVLPTPVTTNNTAGYVAQAIANAANAGIPNNIISPSSGNYWAEGIFQLDADFQAGTNALEALQTTVSSEPFGFLYEEFDANGMRSTDQTTRSKLIPDFELTGDEILDDWQVGKKVNSQVTEAIVNYVGGTVTYTLPSNFGELQRTYDTIIVSQADAEEYAFANCVRGVNLRYEIPQITIPVATMSSVRQNQLIGKDYLAQDGIRINSLIRIPVIRSYIETDYFVEGWTERISKHRWDMTLHLSDANRTRYFQKWNQVTALLEWQDVEATTTWDDLIYEWI
jgi:hypothetical protein